jgi:predicted SprT family Zn-dependent metalloprotease
MQMSIQQATQLATGLMRQFGLSQKGWQLRLTNTKKRLGACRFARNRLTGEIIPGTIELSRLMIELNDFEEINDTIRHEIAHALTPGHNHDRVWRAKAIECGAKPNRCSSTATMPKGSWVATCNGCNREHTMHRKPKYADGYSCRRCGRHRGKLNFEKVAA